jgi:hypothetical protein
LVPDRVALTRSVGTRQQDAGRPARRPHDDPPLRTTVVRRRRCVIDQLEAKDADEELDRRVVVVDDDGGEVDVDRASVRSRRASYRR